MSNRDFVEERRYQRIREELGKHVPEHIREIYEQNPLMEFLLNAPAKEVVAYRNQIQEEMKKHRLSKAQIRKNNLDYAFKDIKYIIKRWSNGENHFVLAEHYGVSARSMRKLIRDHYKRPNGPRPVEDKERTAAIVTMREQGATWAKVAEAFNISAVRAAQVYRRYQRRAAVIS